MNFFDGQFSRLSKDQENRFQELVAKMALLTEVQSRQVPARVGVGLARSPEPAVSVAQKKGADPSVLDRKPSGAPLVRAQVPVRGPDRLVSDSELPGESRPMVSRVPKPDPSELQGSTLQLAGLLRDVMREFLPPQLTPEKNVSASLPSSQVTVPVMSSVTVPSSVNAVPLSRLTISVVSRPRAGPGLALPPVVPQAQNLVGSAPSAFSPYVPFVQSSSSTPSLRTFSIRPVMVGDPGTTSGSAPAGPSAFHFLGGPVSCDYACRKC